MNKLIPPGILVEKAYSILLLLYFFIIFNKSGLFSLEAILTIGITITTGMFLMMILRRYILIPKAFIFILSIFFLINIISTLFSINLYSSIVRLLELANILVLFLMIYSIMDSQVKIKWMVNGLTFLAFITGFYSLYTFLKYPNHIYGLSHSSVILDPFFWNTIASIFFFTFALLSLYLLLESKSPRLKTILSTQTIVLSVALILTKDKWMFSVALIPIILLVVLQYKKLRSNAYWISGIVIVSLFSALLINHIAFVHIPKTPLYTNTVLSENKGLSQRLSIYGDSLSILKNNFLLGTGPSTFSVAYMNYQTSAWNFTSDGFSEILQNFSELGILGGSVFLFLLGYIYYLSYKYKKFLKKDLFASILITSITGIIVYSLISNALRSYDIFIILFTLIAFYIRNISLKDKKFKNYLIPDKTTILQFVLPILIFIAVIFIYSNDVLYEKVNNYVAGNQPTQGYNYIQKQGNQPTIFSNTYKVYASIYALDAKYNQAISATNKELIYNPKDPEAYYNICQYYVDLKNYSKAVGYCSKAIKYGPYNDPNYYLIYGTLINQLKKGGSEESIYASALKKFPLNSNFYQYQQLYIFNNDAGALGDLYVTQSTLINSKSDYNTGLLLNPFLSIFYNKK